MVRAPSDMPVLRATSWHTMSVPPVLPPLKNTMPRPTPTMTPPQMAEMSSCPWVGRGTTGARASVRKPEARIPSTLWAT